MHVDKSTETLGSRLRNQLASVALVSVLGIIATACGGGTSGGKDKPESSEGERSAVVEDDSDPVPGGTLLYALEAETDGYHPGLSRWAPSGLMVARSIFDMLAVYDENGEWQPWLAESFTPNEDYTEWVIKLREGVTFHDGTPLDAAAVLANFEFHMDSPLTNVPFEPMDRENIEVVDDLTLRVPLEEPWVNMPNALTTQIGAIAQPELMQAASFAQSPVGTGPFKFDSWQADTQLTVVKNAEWWYEGYPYLDRIEFTPVPDGRTRISALVAGDIQVAMISDAEVLGERDEVVERDGMQWFELEGGETNETLVMLNTAAPPFDNIEARRALALATPVEELVETLFADAFEIAEGPFAPSSPYYTETEFPSFDLVEARKKIDELGGLSFEMLGVADPTSIGTVQYLLDKWKDAGIDVKLKSIEQAQFITTVLTGQYQATFWRQFDSPHPLGDSIWWLCDSATPIPQYALNFARNCDEEGIDAELDAARRTTDKDEEIQHYQNAMKALAKDLPYVWLYHMRIAFAAQPSVRDLVKWTTPEGATGLPVHGGSHPLYQVWVNSQT